MLQGRLTSPRAEPSSPATPPGRSSRPLRLPVALLAIAVGLAACAGGDDTTEADVTDLELTPVTAATGDGQVACSLDASALRGALDAYLNEHGAPAPDEAALVDAGLLAVESSLWDVVDGELVADDAACVGVPSDIATAEIVTEQTGGVGGADELATLTPDDVIATLSDAEIAEVGGPDCALEVAAVSIAFGRWVTERGAPPDALDRLLDEGDLAPLELWIVEATALVPIDGSGCIGPIDVLG